MNNDKTYQPPQNRIVRPREACSIIGVSSSTLYRMIRRGDIPKPIKLSESGRVTGWFEHELMSAISKKRETEPEAV
jgi:prophage regulatory protein